MMLMLAALLMNIQTSASDPVPPRPLSALVSADDYPSQAIANRQSGTVRFRLDVSPAGRVDGCTILHSSRSNVLDASTCRLMQSRARFAPARGPDGQPVAGRVEDEISWVLPRTAAADVSPRLLELFKIYTACAMGDAARRSASTMNVDAVLDAAFANCAEIETLVLAEMTQTNRASMVPANAMRRLKDQLRPRLAAQVNATRKNLMAR